ncbi:MAG: suppressor of fused domain protein [Lishizhenia sp.]
MTEIEEAMIARFGEGRVQTYQSTDDTSCDLLLLSLEKTSPVTVIMTNGLFHKNMPVPEKLKGRNRCELYFCLPDYWDWEDVENPQMNWVFTWIQKFAKHLLENDTWYGPGHSFPAGKPPMAISKTMQQSYFMLSDPLLLEAELEPVSLQSNEEVSFYGIIPIFEDEFDFKVAKTTAKFLKKFTAKRHTEKLDDFRESIRKLRYRIF